MQKNSKSLILVTCISLAVVFLTGCGSDKSKAGSSSAAQQIQNPKETYESLAAQHGEDRLQVFYVDVMAHSMTDFLKDAIEDNVDIMKMTAEERAEYAKKRGVAMAGKMLRKIEYAVQKNGFSMDDWRAVSIKASSDNWYEKLSEQIQSRKAELKTRLEANNGNLE